MRAKCDYIVTLCYKCNVCHPLTATPCHTFTCAHTIHTNNYTYYTVFSAVWSRDSCGAARSEGSGGGGGDLPCALIEWSDSFSLFSAIGSKGGGRGGASGSSGILGGSDGGGPDSVVGDPALTDATVSYWGDGFSLLSLGTSSQCTSSMCSLRICIMSYGTMLHGVSLTVLSSDKCFGWATS